MSLWSRIFGRKPEREFVLPAYPAFDSGFERVAETKEIIPAPVVQVRDFKPDQRKYRGAKPWNKIKAAQKIASGVLADIRNYGCEGAYTIPEIDECIRDHCRFNNLNIGGLTYTAIRAAMKCCSGVRFENRRLKDNPAYEILRFRHKARKQLLRDRAWIFIIDFEPDHVEASLQPERRAA